MQSHISQLSSPCPKGSVGGVGKKDGLVKIEHFGIGPLQPGKVVMVVCIVDRHLHLNRSYLMLATHGRDGRFNINICLFPKISLLIF